MSAANAQQLRERITFDTGRPVEISLDRDGSPAESTARDGSTEYRYFLGGHQIMWVPAAVHAAIQRAAAGDGAQFAITKHRAPKPWTVVHVDAEPAEWTPDPQPRQQQPAPRPAPTPVSQPRQQQPEAPTTAPHTSMYAALCAAIRTAAAAETFAQQIGRPLAFETADIRAIAATLFIQGSK